MLFSWIAYWWTWNCVAEKTTNCAWGWNIILLTSTLRKDRYWSLNRLCRQQIDLFFFLSESFSVTFFVFSHVNDITSNVHRYTNTATFPVVITGMKCISYYLLFVHQLSWVHFNIACAVCVCLCMYYIDTELSLSKKAQQRMNFLRLLKMFNLPKVIIMHFYTASVESILICFIYIWYAANSVCHIDGTLHCTFPRFLYWYTYLA